MTKVPGLPRQDPRVVLETERTTTTRDLAALHSRRPGRPQSLVLGSPVAGGLTCV